MAKNISYFRKSLIFNAVHLKCGKTVNWIRVGRHDGVVETDDADIITALKSLAAASRLGVTEITKDEFEAQKKIGVPAQQEWQPRLDSRGQLNLVEPPKPPTPKKSQTKESAAAGKPSEPVKADKPVVQSSVFADDTTA